MANYVVIWKYTDDKSVIGEARQAHLDYLQDLVARGTILVAGGWPDASGGLVVFDVVDREELQPLLDNDPFTTSGVIVDTDIQEWKVALGAVGAQKT